MRNLIIIMFVLLFSNCNGYQPIFDSSGLNFYLKEITLKDDSSISRHLSKRLEPLRSNTEIEAKDKNILTAPHKDEPKAKPSLSII